MARPDLEAAAAALDAGHRVLDSAWARLATGELDDHQVVAYDLVHATAGVEGALAMLDYGARGEIEAALTVAAAADALWSAAAASFGREGDWGIAPGAWEPCRDLVQRYRSPEFLSTLANDPGPTHLPEELQLVAETFRRFADERIRPVAEEVHRKNLDIPEDILSGLAELGAFGLSIPERYGGFAAGGGDDYLAMVVATEELSRGSLAVGGSLATRPEILTRALLRGGTEEQRHRWLPSIAQGRQMVGVAVTEPDFGSDVAGLIVSATPAGGGWEISGTKTWSTFAARADVLMVLARTNPDRSQAHRGLSLLVVPKPRGDGRGFVFTQEAGEAGGAPGGGRLEGRPIDTIGYRGMHSYELSFDHWWVPADCLVGGDDGVGRGFYLQMEGFENGRLQTAGRAIGLMQAAYEAALAYAKDRTVFGQPVAGYQLSRAKLGRMAATIQMSRQFAYKVARLMAKGEGSLEASIVKASVCRAAEWVTREALQLHGGYGYAEEYPVSRYFVDARVLSIFEGADETLALRVIARGLAAKAAKAGATP